MEILNTFTPPKETGAVFLGCVFVLVGVCCFAFMCMMISEHDNEWYKPMIYGIICTVASVLLFIWYAQEPKARINALIDDSYPATDLYDNYKVLEHNGRLWVLEEK